MNTRIYRSRKPFKVSDTFLWMGRKWRIAPLVAEYNRLRCFMDADSSLNVDLSMNLVYDAMVSIVKGGTA